MNVNVYEEPESYLFVTSDETTGTSAEYRFGKEPPEGQTLENYLQNCKQESLSLAELAITQNQAPQEIVV